MADYNKDLAEMSIEELKLILHDVQSKSPFKSRKLAAGEDGALLLDPNNPHDREWYENDEDYNV
ncbi:MAG: hypothetical protein RR941_06345 [Erysipelotrichaceae bacterium]